MAGISCSLCLLPPQTLCADVGDTRLMARMKFAAQSSDVYGRHVFSVSESPVCQNLMYQTSRHTTSMVHMSADAHDEAGSMASCKWLFQELEDAEGKSCHHRSDQALACGR